MQIIQIIEYLCTYVCIVKGFLFVGVEYKVAHDKISKSLTTKNILLQMNKVWSKVFMSKCVNSQI